MSERKTPEERASVHVRVLEARAKELEAQYARQSEHLARAIETIRGLEDAAVRSADDALERAATGTCPHAPPNMDLFCGMCIRSLKSDGGKR